MQLSDYGAFPAALPIIVEDDLFLYPFMISPLFLNDEENIAAANEALENNSLVLVASAKPGEEGTRDFDTIYKAGVIGSIMRKVALPDGRVKILFQGISKGRVTEELGVRPLKAMVEVIHTVRENEAKIEAIGSIMREKVRVLAGVSNYFPPDLLKTIEENSEMGRICDLVASSMRLKKSKLMGFLWKVLWKSVF